MYKVTFDKCALIVLKKLDKFNQKKILKKIRNLEINPQIGKPLIGMMAGYYRLRVGKYRVIYKIFQEKLIVVVVDLGHRKNIYD